MENCGLPIGDLYKEKYEKKKELGRGKFGVVHEVEDVVTMEVFAAKHIKTRKKEQKEKAMEEIAILNQLLHPNIINYVGAYDNKREVIVIMEYLGGGELFEKVSDEDFTLTEADCCVFLRQICLGVQYLHSNNIVHLDLKVSSV